MASHYVLLALLLGAVALFGCGPTAPAPTVSTAQPDPPRYQVPAFERLVLDEVNWWRALEGRPPLRPDDHLSGIARAHSRDMMDRGFIAHRTPEGSTPGDRARRAEYAFTDFGENIFSGGLYDTMTRTRRGDEERTHYRWHTPEALAALVGEMWMESPSHRENMLAEYFDYGGVGVAIGPEYDVLVTLNLSAR